MAKDERVKTSEMYYKRYLCLSGIGVGGLPTVLPYYTIVFPWNMKDYPEILVGILEQ